MYTDGGRYVSAVEIPVRAVFGILRLPEGISTAKMRDWQPPGGVLVLNQRRQVVIGRPSDLASLQEPNAWAGPEELSAEAKIGYDDDGLLVYVKVHDAHARLPQA